MTFREINKRSKQDNSAKSCKIRITAVPDKVDFQ